MDKPKFTLSTNEYEILETMWREQRGLTRSEVIDLTNPRSWKKSSIHILLNQLLDKGAIGVEGTTIKGINTARIYAPTLSKEEYDIMQLQVNYDAINPSGKSFTAFMENLLTSHALTKETLKELEQMLEEENKKENKK